MAEENTVTVAIPRAVVWRGRAYGPGREVEVPTHVAKRLGLEAGSSPAAGTPARGGKRAKAGK